jgi:hypothetical protein
MITSLQLTVDGPLADRDVDYWGSGHDMAELQGG